MFETTLDFENTCDRMVKLVGLPGIEPGLHPPHGRVLPVYYSPNMWILPGNVEFFELGKEFFAV